MNRIKKRYMVLVFIYLFVIMGTNKVSATVLNTYTAAGSEPRLSKIAEGLNHSAAIKSDGTVWVWGSNLYGQLATGNTDTDAHNIPIKVQGISNAVSVAAGEQNVVVLKDDGTVADWGGSYSKGGQVELTNIISVAAGGYHSMALKSDGTVWTWGSNNTGQLGDGTETDSIAKPVQVKNLTNVIAIAAAYSHSLALKSDGTVWAWGCNSEGQLGSGTTEDSTIPIEVKNLDNVKDITAGQDNSTALKNDGTVWAWGGGYIGDGVDQGFRLTPVKLEALTSIKKIISGNYYSCAMDSDNNIWMWGINYYGQFGDGSTNFSDVPKKITDLNSIADIKCGGSSSVALHEDGTVWTWGSNSWGNLGNGTNVSESLIPVQTSLDCSSPDVLVSSPGDSDTNVSVYKKITIKFSEDILPGSMFANITLSDLQNNIIPTTRSMEGNMLTIYPGSILSYNTVYKVRIPYDSITDNSGNPILKEYTMSYTTVSQSSINESIEGSIPADGSINNKIHTGVSINFLTNIMQGSNYNDISLTDASGSLVQVSVTINQNNLIVTPKQPLKFSEKYNLTIPSCALEDKAGNNIFDIYHMCFSTMSKDYIIENSSGGGQALAVTADGRLFAWGRNDYGQVGNGQIDEYNNIGVNKPVQVQGLSNIIAAAGGREHSLALKGDGTIWAWGSNWSGQLGVTTIYDESKHTSPAQVLQITGVTAIAAGGDHSMALKSDGTVWTWGSNYYGQLGYGTSNWSKVPEQVPGLTDVIAISAGERHSLALKKDGTVWAWGYNTYGELGIGTNANQYAPAQVIGLKGIIGISAGNDHSIALKSDGTVVSWDAYPADGLTLGGANLKDIVSVSAGGGKYNIALKKDGTAWIWGNDDSFNNYSSIPIQVPNIEGIKSIHAGSTNVAISEDGYMWAWGDNSHGGLGDGTNFLKDSPVKCLVGTNYSSLNSIIPADASTNVSVNSDVHIIFTSNISWNDKLLSIALKDLEGNTVQGRVSIDSNTFSFIPLEQLKYNTKYTLNIPGSMFQLSSGEVYSNAIAYSFKTEGLSFDLNDDGDINIRDFALLARNYNVSKSNESWIPVYDFNSDGIIDIYDLVMMSKKLR